MLSLGHDSRSALRVYLHGLIRFVMYHAPVAGLVVRPVNHKLYVQNAAIVLRELSCRRERARERERERWSEMNGVFRPRFSTEGILDRGLPGLMR